MVAAKPMEEKRIEKRWSDSRCALGGGCTVARKQLKGISLYNSSVEREAKLKEEHLLSKTLGKHQRSSGVEKKLAENLHRNVVQELDGIRNGNYQLQFQNRGMKKALQRLRNRLKENIKEPD